MAASKEEIDVATTELANLKSALDVQAWIKKHYGRIGLSNVCRMFKDHPLNTEMKANAEAQVQPDQTGS